MFRMFNWLFSKLDYICICFETKRKVQCSFCTREQQEAGPFIEGPFIGRPQVFICDICIDVCRSAMDEMMANQVNSPAPNPGAPAESD
jgi:hypothetical protein